MTFLRDFARFAQKPGLNRAKTKIVNHDGTGAPLPDDSNMNRAPGSRDHIMTIATRTPTSPARVAANQRNALRSTGPKTCDGKARSRVNAVRHGLSGAGIALATEDAAAVAERFDVLRAEMGADTMLQVILVKQVALMSVRLDRAALQEAAALSTRVRHAVADFDRARGEDLTGAIAALEAGSGAERDGLLGSSAGLDHLIGGLTAIKTALIDRDPAVWTHAVGPRLEAYLGHEANPSAPARTIALFLATMGDFRQLDPVEMAPHHRATWCRWAQAQLVATIDAEVAHLAALRSHLTEDDAEIIALDRSEAQARALFDPSHEAHLARRYEAEARRAFFRSLREFRTAPEAAPVSPSEIDRPSPTNESGPDLPDPTHPASPTRNEPNVVPVGRRPAASKLKNRSPEPPGFSPARGLDSIRIGRSPTSGPPTPG